jgi:hypothetical protein
MAAVSDVFDGAVRVLVGAGPVKQRLTEAWRDHLAPLQDKDVPEALRADLATVRAAMHAAPATGGMTMPEVSVRKMSEQDAAAHALRILGMYARLCASADGEANGAPRLRIVGHVDHTLDDDDLPAFLSRA